MSFDAGFMEVLASCEGAEDEVDYTDDRWKPPVGDYTCLLETFKTGTKEKNGRKCCWAKPILRILAGDYKDHSFGDFFWFSPDPNDGATKMTRKRFLALATCLSGQQTRSPEEAYTIITEAAGSVVVNLRVSEYVSKKTKRKGRSVRYLGRVVGSQSQ